MARVLMLWLLSSFWFCTAWLGGFQASPPQFSLLNPSEATVGQTQTWYLSLHFAGEDALTGLVVENGSPEAWEMRPVSVDAPRHDDTLVLSATATRHGTLRPRLLVSYILAGERVQQVVLGESVSIQRVENQMKLQVNSPNEKAQRNQLIPLVVSVENQSPFPITADLNLAVIGQVDAGNQSITLASGEQTSLTYSFSLKQSGTPLVQAKFAWTDDRQANHTVIQQAAGSALELAQSPLEALLPTLASILLGGAISLMTTWVTIRINRANERKDQLEKNRRQAEGLMKMVLMHFQQAHACRGMIETKFLDELLQNNHLYEVLREQGMAEAAQTLWAAGQLYNEKYKTAQFSEQFDRLNDALEQFNQAFEQRRTGQREAPAGAAKL